MLTTRVITTVFQANSWMKVAPLLLLLLLFASCGTGRRSVAQHKTSTTLQDDIIQYGKRYLGKPYRYAGKGPNAFDCSGYTSFVFKKFGYRLSSSSTGQDKQTPTIVKREKLQKGDLVFFEGNRKNGRVGHVGIVTEAFPNGHFKFIHSSTSNGVIISSSKEPYYSSRYLRGGRVLEENASYVTKRDAPSGKKPLYASSTTSKEHLIQPNIPEVSSSKVISSVKETLQDEGANKEKESEIIVLVQTDPLRNPNLQEQESTKRDKGKEDEQLQLAKSKMILREEDLPIVMPSASPIRHIVQMSETLYSISRLHGCSIEQLKAWNPTMDSVLKPGDILLIHTNHSE